MTIIGKRELGHGCSFGNAGWLIALCRNSAAHAANAAQVLALKDFMASMSRCFQRTFKGGAMAIVMCLTSVALADNLALVIDPVNGLTMIENNSNILGSQTDTIDGYEIGSTSSSLVVDTTHSPLVGWDSIANTGAAGWAEVSPTSAGLAELNLTSSKSIPFGQGVSLGYAFKPNGNHDVTFGYSSPGGQVVSPAAVQYATVQTLYIDVVKLITSSGSTVDTKVVLLNPSSVQVVLDSYQLQSSSGSLTPAGFHGFAAQGAAGWESVSPTVNALAERNLSSSSAVGSGGDVTLGSAFAANGAHDLAFTFHIVGSTTPSQMGTVVYTTNLAGDANHDGIVNAQDVALIAANWLHPGILPGDVNYDGIANGQDIAMAASNWLQVAPPAGAEAMAVPEPGSLVLLSVPMIVAGTELFRRRRRLCQAR